MERQRVEDRTKTDLDDDWVMLPDQPPTVEGRIPSAEEMEAKAQNGRYYLQDINVIKDEFQTHDFYECRTDLASVVPNITADVKLLGYEMIDSSERLNGLVHCLQLTIAWASVVREARTTKTFHILRRTPENCGAMLMLQRMEHLRGQCTEMAPVAFIALVRDDQLIVTRDRVADQATSERIMIEMARRPLNTPKPGEVEEVCEEDKPEENALSPFKTNMPNALFTQQIRAIESLLKVMPADAELEEAETETETDAIEDVTQKLGAVAV